MRFDCVISGGLCVTASETFRADIGIQNGKIAAIGTNLTGDRTIDATGKYVMPGAVDTHTHLEMPFGGTVSKDNFETGTIAAAFGGTTSIVDFCIQGKGQSLQEALDVWHAKADGRAVLDYGFHIAITDMTDPVLEEMKTMIDAGCPSFKVFMVYDFRVSDTVFMQALIQARDHGGLVCVHAENNDAVTYLINKHLAEGKTEPRYHALSRPPLVEGEATGRACKLAQITGGPLFVVHLTCDSALQEVVRAREAGAKVMAETCPQYLLLSTDNYNEPDFGGAKYVMSPPLRPKENQEPLWRGLAANDLVSVTTDHCPFDFNGQKDMGKDNFAKIPNGAPGIEPRLALMHEFGVNAGRFDLNRLVAVCATNPAKAFGLYPHKGSLAVGADADIVVFDPEKKVILSTATLHENVDYTPYEGLEVTGFPVATLSRGEVVCMDGTLEAKPGRGRFIKRGAPRFV